jgi:hypothetical protein
MLFRNQAEVVIPQFSPLGMHAVDGCVDANTYRKSVSVIAPHSRQIVGFVERGWKNKRRLTDEDVAALRHEHSIDSDRGSRLFWTAVHPNQFGF